MTNTDQILHLVSPTVVFVRRGETYGMRAALRPRGDIFPVLSADATVAIRAARRQHYGLV